MGHRYLQGYVFSRPLEADQLADGAWEAWRTRPRIARRPRPIGGGAVMTELRSHPPQVRWTVPLALLGLALAVPFSAPDGTGMQWDELVLGGIAASTAWRCPADPRAWTARPPARGGSWPTARWRS